MVVAIVVTVILLIFVIPQFESLFKGFGADLPAFTQFVIDMSRGLQDNGAFVAMVLGAAGYTFFYFKKRSRKMREFLDRAMLKFPIIGPILYKGAIARFARTLSTMFAAGVPLVEALDSVGGASGNTVYSDATVKIQQEVSTGTSLTMAMTNANLFPSMVLQMTAIGEESGSIDHMLGKAADFYESEVDDMVAGLSSLMEPIIIVFLGVIIGGIVVSMYLPIFKLGQVV
jgi:type IV pilus assembly protein PilC